MRNLKNWIDVPPVWLVIALSIGWVQSRYFPLGFGDLSGADANMSALRSAIDFLGGILVGAGIVLFALAAYEMYRQRTTIIPHHEPAHLVTTGIFSRSRNPIYLGDALILAGFLLKWDAIASLALVPIFIWIIERRFILREESVLRRKFRADFARYCHNTRRWV